MSSLTEDRIDGSTTRLATLAFELQSGRSGASIATTRKPRRGHEPATRRLLLLAESLRLLRKLFLLLLKLFLWRFTISAVCGTWRFQKHNSDRYCDDANRRCYISHNRHRYPPGANGLGGGTYLPRNWIARTRSRNRDRLDAGDTRSCFPRKFICHIRLLATMRALENDRHMLSPSGYGGCPSPILKVTDHRNKDCQ
jgi:hypothetical protein